MDADLIALRIKVTGGKSGAAEVKTLNREVAKSGAVSKQASAMATRSSAATSAAFKKQAAMMQSAGRTMTFGLTAPLVLAGAMAVKTAASFDRSMAQVKTATGLGGRGMKEMEALALKWGSETIFSANESAEAMLELTKSGISPAQTKAGALGATMNLAATEGLALGKTAEIVGATMNTFGLRANEATLISDALAGGALASSASVGGLSLSLSQGGQSAAMYGLSVQETVGALAAFAQNGIQASDAGTSFKTFLMRLNPTTKKAREEMARLNLDFFDSSGKMKNLRGIADELRSGLSGLSDEQRGAALNVMFGSDAIRAANIIYKEGAGGLGKYITATKKSGAAEKMAEAQMTGLAGSLENLKGSLETAAVHLGHALAPAVEGSAIAIGGLADSFAALPPGVQSTIAAVGALTALAGPVLWFAGSMAKAALALRELRMAETFGGAGKLGSWMAKARLGGGIAGLGALAGGSALGGKGGELLSNVGGGAGLGFAVGGPMGAAVGATAGAVMLAIPQVQKLISGERQLTIQQLRLAESSKSVKEWWERQRVAARGLVAADERVQGAERRSTLATREVGRARRNLAAVISEYGAKSRPAIHAEAVLTTKIGAHTRALNRLREAERLRGVALRAYKVETNFTVLAERHRINVLTALRDRQSRLFQTANKMGPQSERTRELASKLLGTEDKLSEATRKHAQTLADAAAKGGQKYARFLQNATQESIRAGGAMKMLDQRAKGLQHTMERLAEQEFSVPGLGLPGTPSPIEPMRRRGGHNHNTSGRITPAPATQRLRASVLDPQPSARVAGFSGSGGGGVRYLVTVPLKVGKQALAEATLEAEEDAKARL